MADPHEFHTPKSHYTKEDLLLSGQGGYFGPGNAQLPAPPMLMMDRITELSLDGGEFGKGYVVAELDSDEAAPPEACANLRAVMGQQVSTRLGRMLPDGAAIAAKTGSLTGRVRNEVGVITHPDGRAFAVAVFTRAHAPFQNIAAIEAEMANSAAVAIAALRSLA